MTKKAWINIHNNVKLKVFDLLIDLAGITTLSRKMYETGKISRKVHKKWMARERKQIYGNKHQKTFKHCDHLWLPETVFKKKRSSWRSNNFMWRCSKCHCSCNHIYITEASESFRNDSYYFQFIKEPPTQEEIDAFRKRFSSMGDDSQEIDS